VRQAWGAALLLIALVLTIGFVLRKPVRSRSAAPPGGPPSLATAAVGPPANRSADEASGVIWSAGAGWSVGPTAFGFVSNKKSGTTTVAALLSDLLSQSLMAGGGGGDARGDGGGNMLRLLDGFDVLHHAHPSAAMWIEAVGREAWGAALTFTLVRDPWARAVSLFEQRVSMCSDETSDGDSSDSDSSGDSSGDGSDSDSSGDSSGDSSDDGSCDNCADGKLNFTSAACSMLRTPPRLHTYCTRTARSRARPRGASGLPLLC